MNYLNYKGFGSLYPVTTFDGIGVLSGSALTSRCAVPRYSVLRLIEKYQYRGYKFYTRGEAVVHPDIQRGPTALSNGRMLDTGKALHCHEYRGSEDGKCFTISFDTLERPYEVGVSLHDSKWRVGWRLGGIHGQRWYRYKGTTFDSVTGEIDKPARYFDDSDFDDDDYVPAVEH